MADSDQANQGKGGEAVADTAGTEKPACVALVPLAASVPPPEKSGLWRARPSSIFVTHLIATAAQAPQTRQLRRATPSDAQTAYSAKRDALPGAGRTRQIV
jgi:hypothetical protein